MIEDDALISEAKGGGADAFGVLYDRYHSRIYRFIYLKVGGREEAEDLTHHVFLSAWEHIHGYRHEGHPFSSWLYRIARNTVIDHYRSRRPTSSLEEVDPDAIQSSQNIEASAEQALLLKEVRRAISALRPDQQDVIILRFVDELSVKETALALDKSEGAVKLLQHRGMQELKDKLSFLDIETPTEAYAVRKIIETT